MSSDVYALRDHGAKNLVLNDDISCNYSIRVSIASELFSQLLYLDKQQNFKTRYSTILCSRLWGMSTPTTSRMGNCYFRHQYMAEILTNISSTMSAQTYLIEL